MGRKREYWSLEWRRKVLERDKFICKKCGKGGRYSKIKLEVDHIDGNPFNNADENLQTLCVECHDMKTYGHATRKATMFA